MDIKKFITVFGSFGSIFMESELKDTSQKIDYLLDTCDSIRESEIAGYIYAEGDKNYERIERLKQQITNSCRYMVMSCDTIFRHYLQDAFGVTVEGPIEDLEILTEARVSDPHSLERDRSFISYSLPEGSQPDSDNYTYSQILLGEVDEEGPEIKSGTTVFLDIQFEPFKDELFRLSKTGQMILDVINVYLSNEKDRPRSTVERICTRISPVLSEFELFSKDIDGYELMRMLSLEDGKESEMQPSTMIKNESLALHLLKLLEMDGPEYFRQNDWFERIVKEWGVERLIHNRLYDFHSKKAYNRMKRLCDVVKHEMQIESLKYEERFLIGKSNQEEM